MLRYGSGKMHLGGGSLVTCQKDFLSRVPGYFLSKVQLLNAPSFDHSVPCC